MKGLDIFWISRSRPGFQGALRGVFRLLQGPQQLLLCCSHIPIQPWYSSPLNIAGIDTGGCLGFRPLPADSYVAPFAYDLSSYRGLLFTTQKKSYIDVSRYIRPTAKLQGREGTSCSRPPPGSLSRSSARPFLGRGEGFGVYVSIHITCIYTQVHVYSFVYIYIGTHLYHTSIHTCTYTYVYI